MAHGTEKYGKTRKTGTARSSSRSLTAWKSSALAPAAIGGIGGIGGLETVVMAWARTHIPYFSKPGYVELCRTQLISDFFRIGTNQGTPECRGPIARTTRGSVRIRQGQKALREATATPSFLERYIQWGYYLCFFTTAHGVLLLHPSDLKVECEDSKIQSHQLVGGWLTPLKNMSQSGRMTSFHMKWKINAMVWNHQPGNYIIHYYPILSPIKPY